MTHNPPQKPGEPRNTTGTVNPTPGPLEGPVNLERIEEGLKVITPGPWGIDELYNRCDDPFDALFIANAATDIAALVATIKAQAAELDHLRLEIEQLQAALELGEQVRAGLETHNELDRQERERLKAELAQTGKGFKCACCGEWQPDGVGHRCEGVKGA